VNPNLYIVAGPNGAGKTTFAREFLPNYADCRNFINVDLIAAGLAPLAPETAAFRAGRLMLQEIQTFANQRADFGFETTLSGRSYLGLIRELKSRGYQVHIFFVTLTLRSQESKNECCRVVMTYQKPTFAADMTVQSAIFFFITVS